MELLVAMGLTVFVLAATSKILVTMITNMKQQSKIAETSIESVVGLEILRRDIQSAGFGLPSGRVVGISTYSKIDWDDLDRYTEVVDPGGTDPNPNINPADFNDSDPAAEYADPRSPTKAPPRAFISADPDWTVNDSDYLVMKGANLGRTPASGKFHTMVYNEDTNSVDINEWKYKNVKSNPLFNANLQDTDYVMVVSLRDKFNVGLVEDSVTANKYYTTKGDTSNFEPNDNKEVRLIYGIDSDNVPVAPFNRADYYISDVGVPEQCAPGTGTLVKASMRHADGKLGIEVPVLDCVADMQVVYGIDDEDENGDPGQDGVIDDDMRDVITGALILNASQIMAQVKEVQVYILLHEGRADMRRRYSPTPANPAYADSITVKDLVGAAYPAPTGDSTIMVGLRDFDFANDFYDTQSQSLKDAVRGKWVFYKWRVMKLVENPSALR